MRRSSRRSSSSDAMNPNAGQPPDFTERWNAARAFVVSPWTMYQLPSPYASVASSMSLVSAGVINCPAVISPRYIFSRFA